ncbi:MAG: winged helix DNA-binding protein [Novosphingobium sp.]
MHNSKIDGGVANKLAMLGSEMLALAKDLESGKELDLSVQDSWDEDNSPTAFNFRGNSTESHALTKRFESTSPSRAPLPDPRLIRQIIRQRRLRAEFFDATLFADPAWDILLDLAAARAEHKRVSVTSLCIAAGVPVTTALRWIQQMTEMGLLTRLGDDRDRRRTFVSLSDLGASKFAKLFWQMRNETAVPL